MKMRLNEISKTYIYIKKKVTSITPICFLFYWLCGPSHHRVVALLFPRISPRHTL